jgi:hypothetical protein
VTGVFAKYLKPGAVAMGAACTAIGANHALLGLRSVIGAKSAAGNVDLDSQERFYGAMFAGYGLAWLQAARRDPIPAPTVRFLSVVMAMGGAARVVSMLERGRPQPFYVALTAIEFVAPAALIAMTAAPA